MLTWLFCPRGIPANYRTQDGFGVNAYKMINAEGEAVLVKYHWKTQQGIESADPGAGRRVQATDSARLGGPLPGDRAGRVPAVGAQRPDHERDEHPDSTSTRSTTRRPGPRTSSRCGRSG